MFRPNSASILLLPGFDEGWVIQTVDQLHSYECQYNTISIKRRGVRGVRGLSIQPDQTFSMSLGCTHLLIPECRASLPMLMTEPRIHRLIHAVLKDGGIVLVAASVAAAFTRVGLTRTFGENYHVVTSPQHISDFVHLLIRHECPAPYHNGKAVGGVGESAENPRQPRNAPKIARHFI